MSSFTHEQEDHIDQIIEDFARQADPKYRAGAAEHKGMIWDLTPLQLIEAAMEEAVDSFVYLHTLKEKLEGTR